MLQATLYCLVISLLPYSGVFSRQTGPPPAQTKTTAPKRSPSRPAPTPEEIADARSKHLVWANLATHVYHRNGPLYGLTKRGKFMSEEDAKKSGYRDAAREKDDSKKLLPQ